MGQILVSRSQEDLLEEATREEPHSPRVSYPPQEAEESITQPVSDSGGPPSFLEDRPGQHHAIVDGKSEDATHEDVTTTQEVTQGDRRRSLRESASFRRSSSLKSTEVESQEIVTNFPVPILVRSDSYYGGSAQSERGSMAPSPGSGESSSQRQTRPRTERPHPRPGRTTRKHPLAVPLVICFLVAAAGAVILGYSVYYVTQQGDPLYIKVPSLKADNVTASLQLPDGAFCSTVGYSGVVSPRAAYGSSNSGLTGSTSDIALVLGRGY